MSAWDTPDPAAVGENVLFYVNWSPSTPKAKIHICKYPIISGQTCVGGSWCDTSVWSGPGTSCQYTTQSGDVGTKNYYTFVCDSNNACSSYVSGTFVFATRPTLSSVTDSPDPVSVGNAIRFWVTKPDEGQFKLHICKTNSISGQTCSGGSWCDSPTRASTWYSGTDAYCDYTAQISDAGTKNYYAFVCNSNNICSNFRSGTFTVNVPISAPTVTTNTAGVNLISNSFTLNGNITNTGNQNADLRGFEWGTVSGSYTTGSITQGTSGSYTYGTGAFSATPDLSIGSIYYYRAMAHNSVGWGYGSEFKTVMYNAEGLQKQFVTLSDNTPPDVGPDPTFCTSSPCAEDSNSADYCGITGYPPVRVHWQFIDEGDTQSAFQIQVTKVSTSELVVDTGKVSGTSQSYVFQVSGKQLEWDTTYDWKIMVWDSQDASSDWVAGQRFTTDHAYPYVDFTWTPQNPAEGVVVIFDPTELTQTYGGASIYSVLWSITQGDGDFVDTTTEASLQPHIKFVKNTRVAKVVLQLSDSDGYVCTSSVKTINFNLPYPEWWEVSPTGYIKNFFENIFASLF